MGYVTAGLTALSALGLAPLLSMPDQMYESAIKQGPQGVDGEYKIGPIRGALGLIDPRFTKKGLESGRDRYVLDEIVSKDPFVRQARRIGGIRRPELGESLEDYIDDTSGAVEDALKKQRGESIVERYTLLDNLPQNVRARQEARLAQIREDNKFKVEMGYVNRQLENEYNHNTAVLKNQANIAQNNLTLSMGELDLKRQDQERRYGLYEQQLEDTQKYRNNALLAAALEGAMLTVGGLVNS